MFFPLAAMKKEMSKNKALLLVAGLAAVNYFTIGGLLGAIAFNFGRILLAAWGGWYLVLKTKSNLRDAAMVGVIILAVDHIILKGGSFLLAQAFWPQLVRNEGLLAFGGVLISFVMFAPIAALVSLGGGFLGQKMQ